MNNFKKLLAKAKFDYKYISPDFVYKPSKVKGEIELVHPNKILTTQELYDTYEFASLEQLLQFTIDNPNEQRQYPIGIIWKNGNQFWYAFADGDYSKRYLNVYRRDPDVQWRAYYRFLRRKDSRKLGSASLSTLGHLENIIQSAEALKKLIKQ